MEAMTWVDHVRFLYLLYDVRFVYRILWHLSESASNKVRRCESIQRRRPYTTGRVCFRYDVWYKVALSIDVGWRVVPVEEYIHGMYNMSTSRCEPGTILGFLLALEDDRVFILRNGSLCLVNKAKTSIQIRLT